MTRIFRKHIIISITWLLLGLGACSGPHPSAPAPFRALWSNFHALQSIEVKSAPKTKDLASFGSSATSSKQEPFPNMAAKSASSENSVASESSEGPNRGTKPEVLKYSQNLSEASPTDSTSIGTQESKLTNFNATNTPAKLAQQEIGSSPDHSTPTSDSDKALSNGTGALFARNFSNSSAGQNNSSSSSSASISGRSSAGTTSSSLSQVGPANSTVANPSTSNPLSGSHPVPLSHSNPILVGKIQPTSGQAPPSLGGSGGNPLPLILPPQGPGTPAGNASSDSSANSGNGGASNNNSTASGGDSNSPGQSPGTDSKISGKKTPLRGLSSNTQLASNDMGSGFRQGDEGQSGTLPIFLISIAQPKEITSTNEDPKILIWFSDTCTTPECPSWVQGPLNDPAQFQTDPNSQKQKTPIRPCLWYDAQGQWGHPYQQMMFKVTFNDRIGDIYSQDSYESPVYLTDCKYRQSGEIREGIPNPITLQKVGDKMIKVRSTFQENRNLPEAVYSPVSAVNSSFYRYPMEEADEGKAQ